VIISMADYERLHEHADVADAVHLRGLRLSRFSTATMAEMLDALGASSGESAAS
jgi:antitoxin YefM